MPALTSSRCGATSRRSAGRRRAAATSGSRSPPPSASCDAWFVEQCAGARPRRSSATRFGNRSPGGGPAAPSGPAVLTGSHLDSVLDGGAYDGPLGVVSALAAVDLLRDRGFAPAPADRRRRSFVEEEGSRFGLACLGLAAGDRRDDAGTQARELRDRDGVRLADAMAAAGLEPGARPRPLARRRRLLRRAARRAGPRPGRPRRGGRGGQRDLAARALPLRLHRRGQPRRHDADGGPARPDADLRDDRARRQQAGPARRASGRRSAGSTYAPTAPTPCPSRVTAWLDARRRVRRRTSTALVADDRAAGAASAPGATAPR